jgi:hypothetical protein
MDNGSASRRPFAVLRIPMREAIVDDISQSFRDEISEPA